ncbi:hypothetical protein ON010_g18490 [Phytophthora cinnamomi]|nr:hypothetical protein ON010_g18490 [Phytophthora cinnamomi]
MFTSIKLFAVCIATAALSNGVCAEQAVAQTLVGGPGFVGVGIPGVASVGVGGLGVYGPGVYGPGVYGPGVYGPGVYGPGVGVGVGPAVGYNRRPSHCGPEQLPEHERRRDGKCVCDC